MVFRSNWYPTMDHNSPQGNLRSSWNTMESSTSAVHHSYHPLSNGSAEWFVQTFKRAMRASEYPALTFHQKVMGFLLSYRTTPHATTRVAPASLFLQRHVRTRFDLLRPEVEDRVAANQATQKMHHDRHSRQKDLFVYRSESHGP